MDKTGRSIIATFFLVAGIALGTNYMVSENREDSWLFWIIAFLAIATFLYLWLLRDENAEKNAQSRAINTLRDAEAKVNDVQNTAQSAINTAQAKVAEASANVAQVVNTVADTKAKADADADAKAKADADAKAKADADAKAKADADAKAKADADAKAKADTAPKAEPAPTGEADDLTRVEGIGPKYSEALQSAGVTTFAQIGAMSETDLTAIVKDAGMRRPASIVTWAEQAALAADGKWDELEKLQDELSGGRR